MSGHVQEKEDGNPYSTTHLSPTKSLHITRAC